MGQPEIGREAGEIVGIDLDHDRADPTLVARDERMQHGDENPPTHRTRQPDEGRGGLRHVGVEVARGFDREVGIGRGDAPIEVIAHLDDDEQVRIGGLLTLQKKVQIAVGRTAVELDLDAGREVVDALQRRMGPSLDQRRQRRRVGDRGAARQGELLYGRVGEDTPEQHEQHADAGGEHAPQSPVESRYAAAEAARDRSIHPMREIGQTSLASNRAQTRPIRR